MARITKGQGYPIDDPASREAAKRTRKQVELNRETIEAKALSYLNQYDASAVRLRQVLADFVKRRARELNTDATPYLEMVTETLERYRQNGLLDDRRYGASMARGLTDRGASRRAIQAKLQGRGLASQVIEEVFQELGTSRDSELAAARTLVRKRKLGNYRPEATRREYFQRDLAVLARAGFDFDTAKRALSVEGAAVDDEF